MTTHEASPKNQPNSSRAPRLRLIIVFVVGMAVICLIVIGRSLFQPQNGPPDPLGLIILPKPTSETQMTQNTLIPKNSLAGKFLGAQACQECHQDKFETFVETSHHRTSAPATHDTIMGDFGTGDVIVQSRNPALQFQMQNRDNDFFQTAVVSLNGTKHSHSERFDIVTGSGKMGQTYLYLKGSHLFQLPLSYVRGLGEWVNSPGFPDGFAMFSRPVDRTCLVCHVTHFDDSVEAEDRMTSRHIIYGISCERCHGPGVDHVEFHRQNRNTKTAKHISNPADLSQQRQIEVCGQCHSGIKKHLKAPFSYYPGDPLDEYLQLESLDAEEHLGVHAANQSLRLAKSRCFQESTAMTCTTCHNPHVLERGQTALFSRRCQKCHQQDSCGMSDRLAEHFVDHCVECHMPVKLDTGTPLSSLKRDQLFFPRMWDHVIGIYPKLSRRKLDKELKTLELPSNFESRNKAE